MHVFGFDTETALIRPGRYAPPMACLTYQSENMSAPGLRGVAQARSVIETALHDEKTILVGHNVAYDLAVVCAEWPDLVPSVFAAYEQDRVTDTKLRQQLIDLAAGCYRGRFDRETGKWRPYDYSLEGVARRVAGIALKKDGFRLFYGFLRDVPLSGWVSAAEELQARAALHLTGERFDPKLAGYETKDLEGMRAANPAEVLSYPLDDARATLAVCLAQAAHADVLVDEFRQARAAWWLHLASAWGLRTNAQGVEALRKGAEDAIAKIQAELVAAGLVRANGSRDTKRASQYMIEVCEREGLPVRRTPADGVCLDADACNATEDPILEAYAEFATLKSVLAKDVPALASGTTWPIHSRFDLAETGRTTSSKPNVQNWRRLPGIRECFVPRPGHVFAQADYEGLELRTLAQACIHLLGKSELGRALNAGLDPHLALACTILEISYEEGFAGRKAKDKEVENARQTAKVANFGFPGGLGIEKFTLFAKKSYGVEISHARARELKEQWIATWPEMRQYFAHVALLVADPLAQLTQLQSGRVRGGLTYTYTNACNSYFQGLGADATKHAGWLISRACYVDRSSPLFGSRIVCYVHDEFIVETPEEGAHEAAEELARLMVEGANAWLPDVPATTEPLLMRLWSKDAERLVGPDGRLIPWEPKA